jgi:hypothetical protein
MFALTVFRTNAVPPADISVWRSTHDMAPSSSWLGRRVFIPEIHGFESRWRYQMKHPDRTPALGLLLIRVFYLIFQPTHVLLDEIEFRKGDICRMTALPEDALVLREASVVRVPQHVPET